MLNRATVVWSLLLLAATVDLGAQGATASSKEPTSELFSATTFKGLGLRSLGPALTSGRIGDIAVDPRNPKVFYLAVASGGVWKTVNGGTTWQPIFDDQGSYSIGCVTVDPNDPLVVWVGTGENNSQRSVGYGDGVYKSLDGGRTWRRMGLETSEHVARIVIDPRDSQTVYVAAQGPLWSAGGDRGLYKTTDGGATWTRVLEISQHTGVTDLLLDPRNPDVLYAASYQRRRRIWTLINGGPESAIFKSEDSGKNWRKLENGLPTGDVGRIGLAMAPADPDTLYAIIEAAEEGGFYRSTNAGGQWEKRSDYVSGSPQYYQELVADPLNPDRVYSMDTFMMVTEDGGKSFQQAGSRFKHVDDHALWIDPEDTEHLLAGCDGGLYESFDRGENWSFTANLPVTQFYKITVDQALPFYNVYGGTQDNFTLGGPSRTTSVHGITNREWFVTQGGDGFQPQVDPEDPNIVYSQSQYGNLARFDRASGESLDIQPQSAPGEDPLRWNWDSPLIISPHSHTRLYYAAQRVFRSDDRGNAWQAVSPDLTQQIDRNRLKVMDRIWSVDAVAKNASTSAYGNVVALSESPLAEGLLYAGTDDGLIQVLEPGAEGWRRGGSLPGVPELGYVGELLASRHRAETVYAAVNHHKSGDFRPYVLRSDDRGVSWKSIAGDLPERGSVYALEQDPVDEDLLFAGTEFGVFFTRDGGRRWIQLKGGMPVIAVRDLALQTREGDLVVGTFGRGIYVLDDYTLLRGLREETLEQEAVLFPPRKALAFMPASPLGLADKAFQGAAFYTAPNPPAGAVFTYYLKEEIRSRKARRQEEEKKIAEAGGDLQYPSWEALKAEDREKDPLVLLTVRDADGAVVRRLTGPVAAGFHRVAWDLRLPPFEPVSLSPPETDNPFADPPRGPMVVPGTYTVELARVVDDEIEDLGLQQSVEVEPLGLATLPAADRDALLAFQQKTGRLYRAVLGAARTAQEAQLRLDHLRRAFLDTPLAPAELASRTRKLEEDLEDLLVELEGDSTRSRRNEPAAPSLADRVERIVAGHWASSAAPTATQQQAYEVTAAAFAAWLPKLEALVTDQLKALEEEAEAAGAPWTPGRIPTWQPE